MLKRGCKSEDVRSLQENLRRLGYGGGKIDAIFGEKTEDAVLCFQEAEGLYPDGIVGSITLQALEQAMLEQQLMLHSPGLDSFDMQPDRLPFTRVPADPYRDGYDRCYLRSDAAQAYLAVRDQVCEAGGKLTSSGARRALTARVSPSRSATSFHYLGRALDLHVGSGMERPGRDPYVITAAGDGYWRVYARAPGGEPMELQALTYRSRQRSRPVEGRFLDLTGLFVAQGFTGIRAKRSFASGGSWLGAEWWHFQYERELVDGITTFGHELLKVYSESTLSGSPPWQYRDRIYGVNWS